MSSNAEEQRQLMETWGKHCAPVVAAKRSDRFHRDRDIETNAR